VGLSAIYFGLITRLFFLQLVRFPSLSSKANVQHFYKIELEPKRGDILDRNGGALALSIKRWSVYVHPYKVKDKGRLAVILADALHMDRKDCLTKLMSDAPFVWLKRKVEDSEYELVKKQKLEGIGFIEDARRYYPQKELCANVVGFVGMDNQGLEGIEKRFNSVLAGFPGEYRVERDAQGREITSQVVKLVKPIEGTSIYLTIDSVIQNILQDTLSKTVSERHAKGGVAIAIDPTTGEILAMASIPTFDPNHFTYYPQSSYRNLATSFVFEPGSTFKPITAAAALEEKIFKPDDRIYCENGALRVANYVIHDHNPHGMLSFSDAIQKSSNIGLLKIGQKVGKDTLYNYIKAFGFGEKTGLEVPGEEMGIVPPLRLWRPITLVTVSFGQGIAATPLQMVCAYSAIANGGIMNKPYLVKKVIGPEGVPYKKSFSEQGKRIISIETSFRLREILKKVVEDGTGGLARIDGIDIAGKTGTAQKPGASGGYSDNYVASFIGFFPAANPKIVIGIFIDEPKGMYYGGVVAAPCFRDMAKKIYNYLEIEEPQERIYYGMSTKRTDQTFRD
jgi:cell division protein FtsI/penicillin-binding protein 2